MKTIGRLVAAILGLLQIIFGFALIAWIVFTLDMAYGFGANSSWLHQLQQDLLGRFIYIAPFFAPISLGFALWCIISGGVKLFGLKTDDDQYPGMQ